MIISESTCQISMKFHTDVPWWDAPTPVDFRTGPTIGCPLVVTLFWILRTLFPIIGFRWLSRKVLGRFQRNFTQMFLEWMPRHQSIFGPVRQHERHLVAILVWNLRTWFPMIISESTWRISMEFHTDVSWVNAPTPFDFRTGPTTGAPLSGNFSLKFGNLVSDDYLGKYLADFNQISNRCS